MRAHHPHPYRLDKPTACDIENCQRPHYVNGLCIQHWQRRQKYGDPLAGPPFRVRRGTGNRWVYDENRRAAHAKMSQVTGETADYVKIIRKDPCVYCGAPSEHIDHIIPFADNGPTDWSNLAPACAGCNYRKSRKSLLRFMLGEVMK